jgi:hypothetical protein
MNDSKSDLKLWNFPLVDVGFLGNECAKVLFKGAQQLVGRRCSDKESNRRSMGDILWPLMMDQLAI